MRELGLGAGSDADEDVVKQMEAAFSFMQANPDFANMLQEMAKNIPDDLRTGLRARAADGGAVCADVRHRPRTRGGSFGCCSAAGARVPAGERGGCRRQQRSRRQQQQ